MIYQADNFHIYDISHIPPPLTASFMSNVLAGQLLIIFLWCLFIWLKPGSVVPLAMFDQFAQRVVKKTFLDFICWPLERSSIILFPTDLLSEETKHLRNYGKEAFLCVCVHYFCSEVTTKEDKEDWSSVKEEASSSLWECDKMSKYFLYFLNVCMFSVFFLFSKHFYCTCWQVNVSLASEAGDTREAGCTALTFQNLHCEFV